MTLDEVRSGAEAAGEPEAHLPAPSLWPAVLAAGITLLLFGVVAGWPFSLVGALVMVVALAGWVGENRRGH